MRWGEADIGEGRLGVLAGEVVRLGEVIGQVVQLGPVVDHLGGFSLFVADGKLRHTFSMMGVQVYRQESDTPLPSGEVTVQMEFHADAPQPGTGGDVRLFANGQEIGKGRMDHTVPLRFSGYAGMDIGRDNGGVVDRAYADRAPFSFTGTIKKVVFKIKPHLSADDDQALHQAAHHGHVAHGISG